MTKVVLESPYRGNTQETVAYARRALKDSLSRGEAPIASHLLHTQVLEDTVAEDRKLGIAAGREWITSAEKMIVYTDLGISEGMLGSIGIARYNKIPIEFRKLEVV